MSVEWFMKLREIDSLTKTRNLQNKSKKEEEERLEKLLQKKTQAEEEIQASKQLIISKNSEIADLEKKLKEVSAQKQRLTDYGGDEKKIQEFSKQIEVLEEQGLVYLTDLESIELELSEKKTFLQGLERTITEIKGEVDVKLAEINHDLANSELRIKLLMDELPDSFKSTLLKVTAKNLAHGPFTRIDQGSCFFCRYKISRIDESEIDMQKNLKQCPQCGRIFIPYGA